MAGSKFIKFRIYSATIENLITNQFSIQVEKGSLSTTYEPYKSNILTVNEDVTLRGIGDVQDTLDCLTSEVTERIGEVILDGSEQWSINAENNEGCFSVISTKYVGKPKGNIVSDRLPTTTTSKSEGVMLGVTSGKVMVSLNRETSGVTSISLFKQYLSQNPITVQYQLATESIKTVGLNILDQNGQNVKQLMSFSGGTHINTGSLEGSPLPSVSVSVETDLKEVLKVCSLEGNTM